MLYTQEKDPRSGPRTIHGLTAELGTAICDGRKYLEAAIFSKVAVVQLWQHAIVDSLRNYTADPPHVGFGVVERLSSTSGWQGAGGEQEGSKAYGVRAGS